MPLKSNCCSIAITAITIFRVVGMVRVKNESPVQAMREAEIRVSGGGRLGVQLDFTDRHMLQQNSHTIRLAPYVGVTVEMQNDLTTSLRRNNAVSANLTSARGLFRVSVCSSSWRLLPW